MRYMEVVVRTMGDDADDNDQPTMSALSIAFHLACSTKHTKWLHRRKVATTKPPTSNSCARHIQPVRWMISSCLCAVSHCVSIVFRVTNCFFGVVMHSVQTRNEINFRWSRTHRKESRNIQLFYSSRTLLMPCHARASLSYLLRSSRKSTKRMRIYFRNATTMTPSVHIQIQTEDDNVYEVRNAKVERILKRKKTEGMVCA